MPSHRAGPARPHHARFYSGPQTTSNTETNQLMRINLQIRTADNSWLEARQTIDNLPRKGDLLSYRDGGLFRLCETCLVIHHRATVTVIGKDAGSDDGP